MPRYTVNVSIPESEGFVVVEADSEEEAKQSVGRFPDVTITYVNGTIDVHGVYLEP